MFDVRVFSFFFLFNVSLYYIETQCLYSLIKLLSLQRCVSSVIKESYIKFDRGKMNFFKKQILWE